MRKEIDLVGVENTGRRAGWYIAVRMLLARVIIFSDSGRKDREANYRETDQN